MKRFMQVMLLALLCLSLVSCKQDSLPLPEIEDGMRGELGIDRNINEKTIDRYLGRKDSVYYDMRMLVDEADYEAIGGDSRLSGYIRGFEVVPYPYLCNVTGLPEAVGDPYSGATLFTRQDNGEYVPNYAESMHVLESLFPKDKYIFLMCGGGGYAGMTKQLLSALGWDANKIYNVGGYWYYEGDNAVDVTYEEDGKTLYDFSKVVYHPIDPELYTSLTEKDEEKAVVDDGYIHIDTSFQISYLMENTKDFILYVYLPGCSSCASFDPILKQFKEDNGLDVYAVDLTAIHKESNPVTDRVDYTPDLFIFRDGEVYAYLDAAKNEDLPYYGSLEKLEEWFELNGGTDAFKTKDDCSEGCRIDD